MKLDFKKAKDTAKNAVIGVAQSTLGTIHFTGVVIARGAEITESALMKRSYGQLEHVTVNDRRLKTTEKRQAIVDGYNDLKNMLGEIAKGKFGTADEAVMEAMDYGDE